MTYLPVPNTFANVTTATGAQLDANFTYASGKWVSVKDYGAVGNGSTDDYAAITAAIAGGASVIVFPAGSYRVSAGITVAAGQLLLGLGYGPNVATAPVQIIGDLSVTPIVTLNGGGGSSGNGIKSLGINRAAGAVPANSIGLLVTATNNAVVQDVIVYRCAIGVKLLTANCTQLSRLQTTIISATHLWIEGCAELHAIACRAGKNGGSDVSANEYLRIKGNSDTLRFTQCQFNVSAGLVTRAIYFDTYSSSNGIIDFSQCHFELCTVIVAQTGTTIVRRLAFHGCTVNGSSSESLSVPAAFFSELVIDGCPFFLNAITLDQCLSSRVIGNRFYNDVTINAGSGNFVGNDCLGNVTLEGACVGMTAIGNNKPTGGKTFVNSATGQVSSDIAVTSFVPVISAAAGTITTAAAFMSYTITGTRVSYFVKITITTNGTGSGNVRFTLPYTPSSDACGSGIETSTGKGLSATYQAGPVAMAVVFTDGTYPGANGYVLQVNGQFDISL